MGRGRYSKKPHWKKNKGERNQQGERQEYKIIEKENAEFEKYYKLQNICPDEEWETMMDHFRRALPTAFRITGSRSEAGALLHILQKTLIRDAILAGKSESEIKAFPLPWYPDNLAWQLNLTRIDIRRNEAYFRLHNFLMAETEVGSISRQEAVSMIPPLPLDVEPHHKVLDLCAAPGSKTAQIIEMLHQNEESFPSGYVVANDVDNKRCYMLVHQGKRLCSPAFIVTNHDASKFPDILTKDDEGNTKQLKFDRVLCDVPCSGDGTMRKNVDVWTKWSPSNGLYLHILQYQILKRGLELLKVGGKLVYSTCSLNPIENEAVIHRMLKEADGSVELLDIDLPQLKHCKGLSTWLPCSRDLISYTKFEEVPDRWQTTLRPQMFPPSPEEAPKYHLEKCVRVLPHQQDTGGFFIALLKKTKLLPWEKPETEDPEAVKEETPQTGAQEDSTPKEDLRGPPKKKQKTQGFSGYKEDPFIFMKEDNPLWPSVRDFYGLDPSLNCSNFLRRSEEGKIKNIYLTTDSVREFVQSNEARVKIINVGVKALARADKKWTPIDFRLCQEGLPSMSSFIKKRRIRLSKQDLLVVLYNDEERPPMMELFSKETRDQTELVERGSLILETDLQIEDDGPVCKIILVGWKGNNSLRAYIQKSDRVHFLRLCGADVSKYETNKFEKKADAEGKVEGKEEDDRMPVEEEENNGNGATEKEGASPIASSGENHEVEVDKIDRKMDTEVSLKSS